jgi:hypothetical protein
LGHSGSNIIITRDEQRRNRSHLNPRWDSDFVEVDETGQSTSEVGADVPPVPTINVINDNAMPTTVVPNNVSMSQLLEFVATENDQNRLIHPNLRQRINQILARQQQPITLVEDYADENFELTLSSFQSMVKNINRWLHTHHPTPSTTVYRRSTPTTNPRIAAFNQNASRIRQQALTSDLAESFPKPVSSVRLFNSVFPLGRIFNRWKNGIRLFLRTTHSRQPRDHRTSPCMDTTIQNLLQSDIIRETKSGPFESNIFLVPKSNKKMRPVINLHHLVKYTEIPRFFLPSLFQILRLKPWQPNLWYIKFDFKNAFFNIELHPKSYNFFNFYYNKKVYSPTRLVFGASISPFVMQRFLNAIMKYIRNNNFYTTEFAWGHLDDMLIAHEDKEHLTKLSQHLVYLFKLIGWIINYPKSQLTPVKSITFLGATWSQTNVKRTAQATITCASIWNQLCLSNKQPTGRLLQQIRGYFNYYLSFAGNFFSIINRILLSKNLVNFTKIFTYLLCKDSISLSMPKLTKARRFLNLASDATETQIAACYLKDVKINLIHFCKNNILVNELKAGMLALKLAYEKAKSLNLAPDFSARLYIDNKAVISLINRGRAKWSNDTIGIFKLFNILRQIEWYRERFSFKAMYISTAANPADALSRKQGYFPKVP